MFDFAQLGSSKVLTIGECMIELAFPEGLVGSTPNSRIAMGGDTLNTSIYMARMGVSVSFLTGLGSDPYSEWLQQQWREEGVGVEQVHVLEHALPGLYAIQTDEHGERSFHYWRAQSAARQWFTQSDSASEWSQIFSGYGVIYVSGITLSLMSEPARQAFYEAIKQWKRPDRALVFDINYRARGWASASEAATSLNAMMGLTDVALPTLEDEIALFGGSEQTVIQRYLDAGIQELLIKRGPEGVLLVDADTEELVPALLVDNVIDTTGAGDSYNGAYLSARIKGMNPVDAAKAAHGLAAKVIGCRGAILPKESMSA
jgi:2-dehydro-3-deoxygluconokinase